MFAVCVTALYVSGAHQHAARMNQSKARGDQNAYMQYAIDLYANRHGHTPPIIGQRNRMPLYPAFQSLFYDPSMPADAFFRRGITTSIALSVMLLLIVWWASATMLPQLPSAVLTLVAAFTCFVFKAGYFQADLTYYTLHFLAFVGSCRMLTMAPGPRVVSMGIVVGATVALAHLTKAAAPPLLVLVTVCLLAAPLAERLVGRDHRGTGHAVPWRLLGATAVVATFMLVLWPYLATSKLVFGRYFYNVNSTFYIWYDDWADAFRGTRAHGDRVGWPTLPDDQLPGPTRYLREHSVQQIGARLAGGFVRMASDLWSGFWVLKFATLTVLLTGVAVWPRRTLLVALARDHLVLAVFVLLYFVVHMTLAAFYEPISNTGVARFALGVYLPLLFVAAAVRHLHAFHEGGEIAWYRGATLEWFLVATLALDLPFSIVPRLLTTYGGF